MSYRKKGDCLRCGGALGMKSGDMVSCFFSLPHHDPAVLTKKREKSTKEIYHKCYSNADIAVS